MDYDLIVFGGGNAITVATGCARAGMKVALVEKGPLGGTCPNRGCIPSKLLIAHADVATAAREANRFHIDASVGAIDGDRILADVARYTGGVDGAIRESFPEGLTQYRAHGRFVDDHTIEVGQTTVTAPKIVLATGSRPRRPELAGLEGTPYWTSDDVFEIGRMPASITIVGGGYIGCELAYFFHGVGVETTLVHRGGELLLNEDEEVRAVFQEGFVGRVPTRLDTRVTQVSHDGTRFRTEIAGPDGRTAPHESEALLFAIGRVPNTDRIGIENTGLEPDERGYVESDDRLETPVEGVYALGDVAGRFMFTHSANHEAEYLARALVEGRDDPIEYGPMPHAVFTHPEVAGVGATEQQLEAQGADYLGASVPFTSAARGRSVKEEHGLCKFLVDPRGAILGCHIVGHQASVLLHEVMPAMRWRNDIRSLTDMIHVHPSLSEVVRNAARKAAGRLGWTPGVFG